MSANEIGILDYGSSVDQILHIFNLSLYTILVLTYR